EVHEGVSHDGVLEYIRKMSVLVLPSLSTTKWREQLGHVLIEAMSIGVPVVGSDSGAIPEVIGEAGIVVPEGDARGLAEALRSLSVSKEVRESFATRGHVRAIASYTNDKIAQRLHSFWESALSRGLP